MWNPQCGGDKDMELPNVVPIRMRSSQYGTSLSWVLLYWSPMWIPQFTVQPDAHHQTKTFSSWVLVYEVPNVELPMWSR